MLADIIVIAILVVIFALVIRAIVKSKKAGKNLQCGMDCSHCKGCHQFPNKNSACGPSFYFESFRTYEIIYCYGPS